MIVLLLLVTSKQTIQHCSMAHKLARSLYALSLVFTLLHHLAAADPTGTQCSADTSDTCVCETEKGKIDLTGLSNGDGESARFTDLQDPGEFLYSYNPCMAFYSDTCNDNVYICQEGTDGEGYPVAEDGTEQMWVDTDGTVYLYYTGTDGREARVNLHCDTTKKDLEVTTDGDSAEQLHYIFDITGCDVCPGGCDGGGGGGGGGGGKSFHAGGAGFGIISILIIGVVIYFVAGTLIMKLHYKATGTDIIPNKNIWFALPLLVKDGCVFTVSPCVGLIRQKVGGKKKYDEIPP